MTVRVSTTTGRSTATGAATGGGPSTVRIGGNLSGVTEGGNPSGADPSTGFQWIVLVKPLKV